MKANCRKSKSTGMGWAALLICAGALFLLFNLGIIPAVYKPILISWQMLLIALGLWSLIKKRHYAGGFLLIAIGSFFIYPKFHTICPDYFLNIDINFKTYWPVLLIAAGLFVVFGKNKFRKRCNKANICTSDVTSTNSSEYLEKNLIFGSAEQIVLSPNFKGGEANLMFGELKIDLRKAKLSEGTVKLEVNAMFGSATLYVPSEWVIDMQNSSLFGTFQDNRSVKNNENGADVPRLIITGGLLFGSGEIRD